MAATLVHRGPDSRGVWVDEQAGIALGHRRLSILDLSPEGHQPMISHRGRYVIVFNGEIYNFQELRAELRNFCCFRGSSDTEVILAAFERWGLRDSVPRFNGMFALAVWDQRKRVLYLTRDRAGEKPLYYTRIGNSFLFGSELKALRAHPAFQGEIDRSAVALFMRHGYVPAPYSIYANVWKLPPGTMLKVDANGLESVAYWSAKEVAEHGSGNPLQVADEEAVERLDSLLSDSIRLRMVSDVPLGAFLSGGIDSSTVVALMQKQSSRPVKTYTIGFHESGYNEAVFAGRVARHLGTDHTELYVTQDEAMSVIPQLPGLYDEPFADSSQIPTFLVSKLAREHVTVSLSGDGGDELFGGYTRYEWAERIWRGFGWMPVRFRRLIARILTGISPRVWETSFRALSPFMPGWLRQTKPADKFQKLGAILPVHTPEELYFRLVSEFSDPVALVPGASELPTVLAQPERWPGVPDFIHTMMFLDTVSYLPDDILVKVDRASMGVSLETRVPLLDHRIIEFAWQLPPKMKIRDGRGKWLLRHVLDRYVPRTLIERPKCGFGVPLHEWLRGPLRKWAEELLDAGRLRQEGILNPNPVRQKWSEHLSGKHNWMAALWNVLMFQAWLEEQRVQAPKTADVLSTFA
jgi:asparagine synthase (glutamine-hydrolysing)